jgi:type II restriction enzyme
MGLSIAQARIIENTIKESIRNKFRTYDPESKNMPFHYRLLGKDRMALYSFIQSVNTTFGTSIFEPVAEVLSKDHFVDAQKQFRVGNHISSAAQTEIQQIMNSLSNGNDPNTDAEIERIRRAVDQGEINTRRTTNVDLYVKDSMDSVHLFDLKTAKPNIGNFKDCKRTLLEWKAIYLLEHPKVDVHAYIAIPYNPYEPEPYQRWTLRGMFDLKNELMIADEFWDFLGGLGTYNDLLNCFERAGIELRPEIDDYFIKFNR